MFFNFKKKEYIVDCFTTDAFAFEYCKIMPATKYYPDWFKQLSPLVDYNDKSIPTLKHCNGFIELYKNSFVLPFWSTSIIKINSIEEPGYNYVNSSNIPVSEHVSQQWSGYLPEQNIGHMKIASPWHLKSKDLFQFHWGESIWNNKRLDDFTVLPAVIDFKYNYDVVVNIMFDYREKERFITLDVGRPIVMLTPLVSEDTTVKLVSHLISEAEMGKYNSSMRITHFPGYFEKKYIKKKKFIDDFEKREEKKCPFGFGKK